MKSIREMTPEERAVHYAMVDRELERVSAALVAEHRRRNIATECMVPDYLRWACQRKTCMLFVRHDNPSMKGSMVSRSGGDARFFLPDSQRELRPQTSGRFVLVVVTEFIRRKMPTEFSGVVPDLVGEWTDAERAEWSDLAAISRKINYEIEMTPRRHRRQPESRITNAISPSNAA